MVKIGNFFFRYRNILFVFLYLLLFLPSPDLFREKQFGQTYYLWPLILGLITTFSGQLLRGITIGLAYIMRGGREGKVYAEDLITTGMFRHSRNPLYVGNILMLLGVGILDNSLIYVLLVMPVFFLSTGLRTNWSVGGEAVFIAADVLLFASVAGKLLDVQIAGKLLKWQPGEASIIGWLLQTKALIMIIFANILLDKGVITSETFTALLLMAVASTMLTVPVVSPKLERLKSVVTQAA